MSGYTNRFILLEFPELGDRVSVLLHNPRLLSPSELTPRDTPVGPDGQALDSQAALDAGHEVVARVIAAWHAYDATSTRGPIDIDLDAADLTEQLEALETTEQVRLGEITPESVAKLPIPVINRIGEEIQRVANPN